MKTQTKISQQKQKATRSHFTPPDLAKFVSERILATQILSFDKPITVLDPACGDGELLLAFTKTIPLLQRSNLHLMGVDMERAAFEIANQRLTGIGVGKVDLQVADFLQLYNQVARVGENLIESADVIIANPPYVRTQVPLCHNR